MKETEISTIIFFSQIDTDIDAVALLVLKL